MPTPSDPVHLVKSTVGKEKEPYYFFQKHGSFSAFCIRHEIPVADVLFALKGQAIGLRLNSGAIHTGKALLKLFLNTVLNNVLFTLHYFIYKPTHVCRMTLGPRPLVFHMHYNTETIIMKDYYEESTDPNSQNPKRQMNV